MNNRKLEQTLAWGKKSRPVATSPAYAMKADSLALDTPAQRLTEVRGFGSAWLGGTVNQAIKDRDWMRGDTIVAHFTPVDSAGKTRSRLARIDARHGAQSYHIDANAKLPTRPSINYARGDAITVTMRNGDRIRPRVVDFQPGRQLGVGVDVVRLPRASIRARRLRVLPAESTGVKCATMVSPRIQSRSLMAWFTVPPSHAEPIR